MAGTIGNQNAKGNKGGGRKSAYEERADAEFLWKMFTEPVDKAVLMKKIATGKFSILESMVIKALSGNERLISDIFKKLFPDSMNLTANMNQKQMKQLEDNVKDILEIAATMSKRNTKSTTVDAEGIRKSMAYATEAVGARGKPKVKVKVKVKR